MDFTQNKFRLAKKNILSDSEIQSTNDNTDNILKNDFAINKPDDVKNSEPDDYNKKKKSDEKNMVDKSTDTDDLLYKDIAEIPTNVYAIRTSSNYSAIHSILSNIKSTNMLEYIKILKGLNSLLENKDDTNSINLTNSRHKIMKQKRNLLQSSLIINAPFDRNRLNL